MALTEENTRLMEIQKFITTFKVKKKKKKKKWFDLVPIIASFYEQSWKINITRKKSNLKEKNTFWAV